MRAVIFGVDGLTFQVLHPLIERGNLPNFQRLSQQGCEAILESRYPPITPAAWMSLATGLKPAGHGVYDFWTYELQSGDKTTRKAHVVTHRKGGKAIWNILSEYGKRVLVINVPVTYPPEPVNGIMVSGYMTPNHDVNFTYPMAFKESLYQAVPNYKIDLEKEDMYSVEVSGKADRLIDGTLAMTERRIELTTHLLKNRPWDFCFVAFVGADRLQHPLWDDICALEPRAIEYFHMLDFGLGLILEQLGPDDCLFVVSDHGFQGASRSFEINEYLYSQKLLRLSASMRQDREHARRISNLKHTIERLGLLSLARKATRDLKTTNVIKEEFGEVSEPLDAGLDWDHTTAYVPSHSSFPGGYADIFLSPAVDSERVAELCVDLKRQVDPQSGKPLIEAIDTTEAFGTGPYAPREPHLLLLPADGITFRLSLGNERFWDDARMRHEPDKRCGVHHKDGVLYAYGNGIKQGFNAPHAEVFDLVPTVLRSMGLPIPEGLDGRALDELFVASEQSEDQAKAAANQGENNVVRRKLQKLFQS
jgi:predicted AlkP superfamily phosphohydrolase/phosphomutase